MIEFFAMYVILGVWLKSSIENEAIWLKAGGRIYLSADPILYWVGISILFFIGVGTLVSFVFGYLASVNIIKSEFLKKEL